MNDDELFKPLPPSAWTKRDVPKGRRRTHTHRARRPRGFCKFCVEPKESMGPKICTECVERLEAAYAEARRIFPGVNRMTLPELLERLIAYVKRKTK